MFSENKMAANLTKPSGLLFEYFNFDQLVTWGRIGHFGENGVNELFTVLSKYANVVSRFILELATMTLCVELNQVRFAVRVLSVKVLPVGHCARQNLPTMQLAE